MKPAVKLADGNAFSIIGSCREAWISSGKTGSEFVPLMEKMMSGDYNNLLNIVQENFRVITSERELDEDDDDFGCDEPEDDFGFDDDDDDGYDDDYDDVDLDDDGEENEMPEDEDYDEEAYPL